MDTIHTLTITKNSTAIIILATDRKTISNAYKGMEKCHF